MVIRNSILVTTLILFCLLLISNIATFFTLEAESKTEKGHLESNENLVVRFKINFCYII